VGVSHAAPGHHFADRAALLAALAEEGFGRLADRLEASSVAARSPRRRLEHVGQAYVRFAMEQPALFRLMFARSPTGQPSLGEAARALEALRRAVSRALPAKAGARRREETTLTAWALVHGLAVLWLDGPAAALLANPAAFEAKVARVLRSAVQAYAGPQA
jgi:AcrR family transcriptional regulator